MHKVVAFVCLMLAALHAQTAVLVDISDSMQGNEPLLERSVKDLANKLRRIKVYAFGSRVIEITDYSSFVCNGGGTNMSEALGRAQGIKSEVIFIITDGMPNNPNKVRGKATELRRAGMKICTVYVGNQDSAEAFMRQISDAVYMPHTLGSLLDPCFRHARENNWQVALVKEQDDRQLDSMKTNGFQNVYTDVAYENDASMLEGM